MCKKNKSIMRDMQENLFALAARATNLPVMVSAGRDANDFWGRLEAAVERVGRKSVYLGADVSEGSLSRIVNGKIDNPGIWTVKAIADAAGVTLGELLGEVGFSLTAEDREFLTQVRQWIEEKVDVDIDSAPTQRDDGENRTTTEPDRPRLVTGPPIRDYYSPERLTDLSNILRFRRAMRLPTKHEAPMKGEAAAMEANGELPADDDSGEIEFRQVPDEYWRQGARLVFKARGKSLIDAGITENDLLFVAPSDEPHDEFASIVKFNGTMLVKYVETLERGRYRLHSEDKDTPPLDVSPNDAFSVYGHVIARSGNLLRRRRR